MMVYQRLLHRMQLSIHRQGCRRGDFQAMCRVSHADATVDGVRVAAIGFGQHHGAGAAVAAGASFFGVGGAQLFAQDVKQGAGRWYIDQRMAPVTVNQIQFGESHANSAKMFTSYCCTGTHEWKSPMSHEALLELRGISKQYPAVLANDRITLQVMPGQIHAILGENGAGKSTLMKIIYGAVQPDQGDIRFQGKSVHIRNPQQARQLGISMVFQHFSLFDTLTVAQNVWFGLD
jgi:ABC-type multidrug transport system fused ATPase/permease subunit